MKIMMSTEKYGYSAKTSIDNYSAIDISMQFNQTSA